MVLFMTNTKPSAIASAVEPLRANAVEHARKEASDLADRTLARYAADRTIIDYKMNMTRHERALRDNLLARIRSLTTVVSNEFTRNEEKVAAFIDDAGERASLQYTGFIQKLEAKVGDHTAAVLTGNHVWGYSVLHVTKADGTTENWKTQQIFNVSVLGKLFHQWPSRKVKA